METADTDVARVAKTGLRGQGVGTELRARGPLDPAVVRIRTDDGTVVGAGFLARDRHVLTCAHVVAQALGVSAEDPDPPLGEVAFDFPLVAPGTVLASKVVVWLPVRPVPAAGAPGVEDVAVLEVAADPPAGCEPVRLAGETDPWGHPFRAYGFPAGFDDGAWAPGVLRGAQASGWVQVDGTTDIGYFVAPGFSGGPVWDDQTGAVVGMVVGADRRTDARVGYAIPAHDLERVLRGLGPENLPPCPYRGLFAFREEDADLFFGRERDVGRLAGMVGVPASDGRDAEDAGETKPRSLVAVVGPSGSGKSSVVFAGLVPRVRTGGGWLVADFTPGAHPFDRLAAALVPLLEPEMGEIDRLVEAPKLSGALRRGEVRLSAVLERIRRKAPEGARLLLVADQFEELWTLCDGAEERKDFLAAFLVGFPPSTVPDRPTAVAVLTLRADFLGHALSHAGLAERLQGGDLKLGPMAREGLRAAIERPAERCGVRLEPGLADRILAEVGEEPGRLPLLEFALALLWERQDERRLIHAAYDAIGGLQAAMARHADAALAELSTPQQAIARRVFLRLVQFGAGRADIRRRRPLAELRSVGDDPDLFAGTLEYLAGQRLLTLSAEVVAGGGGEGRAGGAVDLAHEALIGGWPWLRDAIVARRDAEQVRERLEGKADEWVRLGRGKGALLDEVALAEAERWLATDDAAEAGASQDVAALIGASAAERAARERSRYLGQAAGGAVGAGFGFGVLLTVDYWSTHKRVLENEPFHGANELLLKFKSGFPTGALIGFCIGIGLWRARSSRNGRVFATAIIGVVASAFAYVWSGNFAQAWSLFVDFSAARSDIARHNVVTGAILGAGVGTGVGLVSGKWRRLATTTLGGVIAACLTLRAAGAAPIGGGLPTVIAAGLAFGGFTGLGFAATAVTDRGRPAASEVSRWERVRRAGHAGLLWRKFLSVFSS